MESEGGGEKQSDKCKLAVSILHNTDNNITMNKSNDNEEDDNNDHDKDDFYDNDS